MSRPPQPVGRGEERLRQLRPAFCGERVSPGGKKNSAQGVVLRVAARCGEEDVMVGAVGRGQARGALVDGPAVGFPVKCGGGEEGGRAGGGGVRRAAIMLEAGETVDENWGC